MPRLVKRIEHREHFLRQTAAAFRFQRFGHAVEGFGNTARDAGDRVRITAEGHGVSHGILEIRAFEERNNRLGHGSLARSVHRVKGANLIERA